MIPALCAGLHCMARPQNFLAAHLRAENQRNEANKRNLHRRAADVIKGDMHVKILPAPSNNYMYLVIDAGTYDAAIINPICPDAVYAAVKNSGVRLTKALATHYHKHYLGCNTKLNALVGEKLAVYAGDNRIDALTHRVTQNDSFQIGNLETRCLFTPCHTRGDICYYVQVPNTGDRAVFTGDTLLEGGCGRIDDSITPGDMYEALWLKLASLPDDTFVFCGREKTLANLIFGTKVEPKNTAAKQGIRWSRVRRNQNIPTMPSTIGAEKLWNPFLRIHKNTVQQRAQKKDPIEVMAFLRREREKFKTLFERDL